MFSLLCFVLRVNKQLQPQIEPRSLAKRCASFARRLLHHLEGAALVREEGGGPAQRLGLEDLDSKAGNPRSRACFLGGWVDKAPFVCFEGAIPPLDSFCFGGGVGKAPFFDFF